MKHGFIYIDMFPPKIICTGVPLHDVKVGVWYTVNAKLIIGPIFYTETINSYRYVRLILTDFFAQCMVSTGSGNCPHCRQFFDGFGRGVW
jgi:hypothetical protein